MRLPADVLPPDVDCLLHATDARECDAAWERLVATHTTLMLRTTRSVLTEREDVMDAYAFVLEQLAACNYERIRAYAADGRCKFTTWLVVVVRRTCIDFARQRYGRRNGSNGTSPRDSHAFRRQLAAQMEDVIDPDALADDHAHSDSVVRTRELAHILDTTLAGLSIEDRLLLRFRFDDDLPASEIARILAWPSQFHVYRRLKIIFAHCRTKLKDYGVFESEP